MHRCPARIIASPLALTPGTRLGVYEVTAQIGEGGMGQVYRATDTKLKRQVAIKILPPSLAADADRLARFQREAEALASLNHPHIAAIYGPPDEAGQGYGPCSGVVVARWPDVVVQCRQGFPLRGRGVVAHG